MSKLPELFSVADIRLGHDPQLEAWLYHFMTENNIEYLLNPSIVASSAQLAFMVALRPGQIYLPCGDELFFRMYRRTDQRRLLEEYKKIWLFIVRLINSHDLEVLQGRRVLSVCRYRFRQYLDARMLLPSRLVKRLVKVVLTQCGILDPFSQKKRRANAQALAFIQRPDFRALLDRMPDYGDPRRFSISAMHGELHLMEIARLMRFSTFEPLWENELSPDDLEDELCRAAHDADKLRGIFDRPAEERLRILYLPDSAGGFILDLMLIRALLRQGHELILALKDFFYFNAMTIWDLEDDPVVKEALLDVQVLSRPSISKNDLLQLLREHRFLIISDGTSEQLNLYRTSVTFARAWKECDVILAKGMRNHEILLGSSHEFTRDIVAFWRSDDGEFQAQVKPRAVWTHKYSEKDLLGFAKELTDAMRFAKASGKSVMFYSAVIGSIPGQTRTALALVNTFVRHLRERMEGVFIINPAEHFVEGMDGDDLMYMWESVQRSGLIDIWRFQTVEDVEASFALLEEKVPSVWSGKDSTFSTGCTKEMQIALDVQRKQPELQIIGPAPEKFFRRTEYGVGKYYDASLVRTEH